MAVHTITKGLDLPITGAPASGSPESRTTSKVAVLAGDFLGMKPRMMCRVGDVVKRGQPLFEDRKTPGVVHTAPGAGTVVAVHRGEYRALVSVVIELSEREQKGLREASDQIEFKHGKFSAKAEAIDALGRQEVVDLLLESGLWTYLRARPYSHSPDPAGAAPAALYITAADTHPLAASVDEAIKGREADFDAGVAVLSKLPRDATFLCRMAGTKLGSSAKAAAGAPKLRLEEFAGPHPAGTVGYHIHKLSPVSRIRTVWHINYQQVATIGHLFRTGVLDERRVVSLAGPAVKRPRLIETRRGACLDEMVEDQLAAGENRVISGSVLGGVKASGEASGYLGVHHNQISSLPEGRERFLLGWLMPGVEQFSVTGIYVSSMMGRKLFPFTTNTNGGHRAMVPIGTYESVFPFDILPTFLLRSLAVGDVERAEALGALELDEEDLALCTFVCPGKLDHSAELRRNLDLIWKEG